MTPPPVWRAHDVPMRGACPGRAQPSCVPWRRVCPLQLRFMYRFDMTYIAYAPPPPPQRELTQIWSFTSGEWLSQGRPRAPPPSLRAA